MSVIMIIGVQLDYARSTALVNDHKPDTTLGLRELAIVLASCLNPHAHRV